MSVYISAVIWRRQFRTPSQKLVALKLADSANDNGITWPALRTLAEDCGLKPRQARQLISELEKEKLIRRDKRLRENGSQASNVYVFANHILEEAGLKPNDEVIHIPRQHSAAPPAAQRRPPRQHSAGLDRVRGGTTAPPLNQEPKKETARARKLDPEKLSELQKSYIRADRSVMIDGEILRPGSSEMVLLREALRNY